MIGPMSNRRPKIEPLCEGKRITRFLESEVGKRTMFRPSGKEPVHIKIPGRNDICPCGSGLKYKTCCRIKKAP